MNESLELLVIEGPKQGARAPISASEVTSVGNDYDCNVMLGLPGIEHALALPNAENQKKLPSDYPKLEMKKHEGRLLIRVVRGSIQVGQKLLDEGGQAELQPDNATANSTSVVQTAATPTAKKPTKRTFNVVSAVASLCIVVGGAVAFVNYGQTNNEAVPEVSKTVAAELERGGFSGLSVTLLDNDTVAVNGFLQSRAELVEARNLLQSTSSALIEWDVQLGQQRRYRITGKNRKSSIRRCC